MHKSSPFWYQKSKHFLGRGTSPPISHPRLRRLEPPACDVTNMTYMYFMPWCSAVCMDTVSSDHATSYHTIACHLQTVNGAILRRRYTKRVQRSTLKNVEVNTLKVLCLSWHFSELIATLLDLVSSRLGLWGRHCPTSTRWRQTN